MGITDLQLEINVILKDPIILTKVLSFQLSKHSTETGTENASSHTINKLLINACNKHNETN